jgi:hypothetical protein
VRLAGEATRAAVRAYTRLTLARHLYLSTQFPQRRPFAEGLPRHPLCLAPVVVAPPTDTVLPPPPDPGDDYNG